MTYTDKAKIQRLADANIEAVEYRWNLQRETLPYHYEMKIGFTKGEWEKRKEEIERENGKWRRLCEQTLRNAENMKTRFESDDRYKDLALKRMEEAIALSAAANGKLKVDRAAEWIFDKFLNLYTWKDIALDIFLEIKNRKASMPKAERLAKAAQTPDADRKAGDETRQKVYKLTYRYIAPRSTGPLKGGRYIATDGPKPKRGDVVPGLFGSAEVMSAREVDPETISDKGKILDWKR